LLAEPGQLHQGLQPFRFLFLDLIGQLDQLPVLSGTQEVLLPLAD